jgi:hypothetical protein
VADSKRDALGRAVRAAWVKWAQTQPDPKPSWLVPWDELSEADREADRVIAEELLDDLSVRRIYLILKRERGDLSPAEGVELAALQEGYFEALDVRHPPPPSVAPQVEAIERRLAEEDHA